MFREPESSFITPASDIISEWYLFSNPTDCRTTIRIGKEIRTVDTITRKFNLSKYFQTIYQHPSRFVRMLSDNRPELPFRDAQFERAF